MSRINWETLRSIDSATLTGAFIPLGTPLLNPAYKVKLVNTSTVLVTISVDGINAVDVAPANSFFLYDETQSNVPPIGPALPTNTQFYVSGMAGTGLIYLVVQYVQGIV